MSVNPKIIPYLTEKTRAERFYICEKSPLYFTLYYFSDYFQYKIPPFHYDFYSDVKRLISGELTEVAWFAYRESAKTSLAKLAVIIWSICFKKKQYINFDCYVKDNSEAALFDIVVALQTNRRLIADFGQIYYAKREQKEFDEKKLKRISSFITENDIKVEAFSTQESTRGRIYKNIRPDLYIFDDFETTKTKDSYPITKKIIDHIDEARSGLGPRGSILYLGNYITEEGVVENIMARLKDNPKAVIRNIPVIIDNKISWPDKYARTDKGAARRNKKNPDKIVVSLEEKRRSLTPKVFEPEMMNNPAKSGDLIFDREIILERLTKVEDPIKVVAAMKFWAKFNAKHRYGGGGDTAEGGGNDSNALAVIDFTRKPCLLVALYENAFIGPDSFAYDIERAGKEFGECLFGVEAGGTGYACIAELRDDKINYRSIFKRQVKNKTTGKATTEYGFRTTGATKPDIIYQLASAVEEGELEIRSKGVLTEMKLYRKRDLRLLKVEEGVTRHFDQLMAVALAWEMRNHAPLSKLHQKVDILEKRRARKREVRQDTGV